MKKILLILPLMILLSACATQQSNDSASNHSDSFRENPRICFKTLYCENTNNFKKYPPISFNICKNATLTSIREIYGASINDKFNGTAPIAVKPPAPLIKPIGPACPSQPKPEISKQNDDRALVKPKTPVPSTTIAQGTNYIPLTFPVPPPDAMIKQFHMKIGD